MSMSYGRVWQQKTNDTYIPCSSPSFQVFRYTATHNPDFINIMVGTARDMTVNTGSFDHTTPIKSQKDYLDN